MPTITRHGRAFYYDTSIPADDLLRYHRSEKEMAVVFATETCHPARFEIPRHAHDLPSFYVLLEGPRGDLTPRSCATDESPRGK